MLDTNEIILRTILKSNFEIVETAYGFKMALDPRDSTVSPALGTNKVWEKKTSEIIREKLKRGQRFVDAGAHIGYFSMLAATIVGEEGQVVAFEPSPRNFQFLLLNIAINGFKNVIAVPLPLWDTCTYVSLQQNNDNTGDTRTSPIEPNTQIVNATRIHTTTLDVLFPPKTVDFLKIDCQGADPKILSGGKNLILGSPAIQVVAESIEDWVLAETDLKVAERIQEDQQVYLVRKTV